MLSLEQALCVTTCDSLPGFIPIFFAEYILSRGACKYYISTLGVGGGSEGNDYFAYVVRGGGSRGKMVMFDPV